MSTSYPLISILIWLPIGGALIVRAIDYYLPGKARAAALSIAVLTLLLSGLLYIGFDKGDAGLQFVERIPWIPAFNIYYHLGVDGISLPMILLTTFSTLLAMCAIPTRVSPGGVHTFLSAFLLLEGMLIGVFAAADAMLFYVFWEAILIPMFLIIGIWGGPDRLKAAVKFFLYTFLGSVFMLLAVLYLYIQTGSFYITDFYSLSLTTTTQLLLFAAFFLAFAVKIPMWPVHTWLPDAHVEAPTAGSVILAAVLLKLGGYGFLRFAIPVAPDASLMLAHTMIILSLIAIVYIGFVALAQKDMKKLIAYSSIAHMGFVTLGFFCSLTTADAHTDAAMLALSGGYFQMISHGAISAAMFLCVGLLYERTHSRDIDDYGGIANTMPWFSAYLLLFAMANAGLPGTSGFVGEFMVILSSYQTHFLIALIAASTLILGAAYTLWMYKRVAWGPIVHARVRELTDISAGEHLLLMLAVAVVLLLGLWPALLLEVTEGSLRQWLSIATGAWV